MNAYKKAGVDVERGYEVVEQIKEDVLKTQNRNVINNFGSFGGLFDISELGYDKPVLVSGCDGVGTKLNIAIKANDYSTIGQDLVAMSLNDIVTIGAKPLFFLDYIAVNKIDINQIKPLVTSMANALSTCDCALLGGETAEMGALYKKGDFDLAGFVTGVVEKDKMIDINNVCANDVIIGIESSGIHSNGYSLINKTFFYDNSYNLDDKFEEITLKEELLKPTKLYVNQMLSLNEKYNIKSAMHITGGGFVENIPRGIPDGLMCNIKKDSHPIPKIFKLVQKLNSISDDQMYEIFNMGIGMCIVVDKNEALDIINHLKKLGDNAYVIGDVQEAKSEDMRICIR